MWEASARDIPSGVRVRLREDGDVLSFRGFFRQLERDNGFIGWFSETLLAWSYEAFFWELPPLTADAIDAEAEFVLIESAALAALDPDPTPFRSLFERDPEASVVTFPNLGGDALLIAPRPLGDPEAYPHLAAFLRAAPRAQVALLWRTAAGCVQDSLGRTPRWLSTAGLGVSWLHLRIDTRPKYYRYTPYKSDTGR